MQYLKEEVRNRISEAALEEFMEKGYEKASIRSISKNANTSVGNIYKYFKSKEDLYENIIGSVYDRIIDYISQFHEVELNEKAEPIFNLLVEKIMKIFNENSREISTLLNQSKGSKYENCKEFFVEFITRIVTESMEYELSKRGKKLKDNFSIYLISRSLVDSISIIVKEKEDGAEVRKLIMNMIDIYYTGLSGKLESVDNSL
jgi:AcrR family transcriptional regulator